MPVCAVKGCKNRSVRKEGSAESKITFHRFPKNDERRKLWLNAINRSNWNPAKGNYICSTHFRESAFDRTSLSYVRLRDNAIPSILLELPDVSTSLEIGESSHQIEANNTDISSKQKSPIRNKSEAQQKITNSTDIETQCSMGCNISVLLKTSNINRSTSVSPERGFNSPGKQRIRAHFKRELDIYKKTCKNLRQQLKRTTTKISTLQNMLHALRNKNLQYKKQLNILHNKEAANKGLKTCDEKKT